MPQRRRIIRWPFRLGNRSHHTPSHVSHLALIIAKGFDRSRALGPRPAQLRAYTAAAVDSPAPFKGRIAHAHAPMRVLHRFTKPGGHWAEIRERKVTTFRALEYLVFVDGQLSESQMFHGERVARYEPELKARIAQFLEGGWIEEPISDHSPAH